MGSLAAGQVDRDTGETPQAASQLQELPSHEELIARSRVLDRVNEISKFSFTVFYQNNGALTHEDVAEAVLGALLGNLSDMLVKTGIHYLHELKPEAQRAERPGARLDGDKAVVTVKLQHSVFQFTIRVFDDRFIISRESSSFKDFYAWYRLVMPNAAQLEATVRQAVARKLDRPLDVTRSLFEFGLIFSDFEKDDWIETRPPRNVDVLSRILPMVPNSSGSTELDKQEFMRIDLKFSRLEKFGPDSKWRNCWYILEAPSNERGRFLVLTAQLGNVSEDRFGDASGEQAAIPFDPDFTEDYVFAVMDFLQLRALDNFMHRLLEGWKFRTQRQL